MKRAEIEVVFGYWTGDSVLLHCPAYGTPAPTKEWSRYGQNQSVFDTTDSTRLMSYADGSLEISNLTASDAGVYSCTATNSVGSDRIYVQLVHQESYLVGKLDINQFGGCGLLH